MVALDEDALICDFAETYHIYDYQGLPVEYAATLAAGLRADSRIHMKAAGAEISPDTALLACIVDNTNLLVWAKTKDAEKGRNYPKSVLKQLMGRKEEEGGFASAEAYEAARRRILGEI